ncbi:MAG: hypothetical protein A3H59_02030 [Candidatus Jacksonbacteria bacterium RIFCSPLOWO2_02_FULL_43_9]|nr:MAG: hypothetical protein A3H59_02030 [Candidatus Jacksonbacteria bacterium RIFCSPLOWO2_02_FULL_43_9]
MEPTPMRNHILYRMPKFLEHTPPNIAFFLGLLLGVAVASTVGFFVVVKNFQGVGGSGSKVAGTSDTAIGDTTQGPEDTGPVTVSPVTNDDHIRGEKNAPVTLVEYSDYQCPFCQSFHETAKQLVETFPGKFRWVFRHFPLTSIHPEARSAAIAAECVAKIGGNDAFWKFSDALFVDQSQLGGDFYADLAQKQGISASKFKKCTDDKETEDIVDNDYQKGISDNVQGTPGNFLIAPDGTVSDIPGAQPFEVVKPIIEQLLGIQ